MNEKSCSFIDLAKLGRTDWWADVLTIVLISVAGIALSLAVGVVLGGFFYIKNLHFVTVAENGVPGATNAVVAILGFWVACKRILRRPFRSLISADLTFRIRRCLLGAALYLAAHIVSLATLAIFLSMRVGVWMIPFRQIEWPHVDKVIVLILMIIGVPFLAFSEEIFFRGWLTQVLRKYLLIPIAVVAIVAVVFATYHAQYNFHGKMEIFASSLGFSALSLRDQRLELSIGAHTMINICVALETLFLSGSLPDVHITFMFFDWFALAAIKGALPFALMYWFLQKTNRWFEPNRTSEVVEVQSA